ncbi:MAG: DUF2189 domain-containing protein [Parvularcula sp.]|jgi:uncharacterized membrane protein|nr:DUF2189 domain-containing protein [Parvularcula sp.]
MISQAATVESHAPFRGGEADLQPWTWVREGADIYRRHVLLSVGYGLLFVLIGYVILLSLGSIGLVAAMPVAFGAFALAGPLMAAGLYGIARADEEGQRPSFSEVLLPKAASPMQILYLGVIILVAMMMWTIVAIGLFVIFLGSSISGWEAFAQFVLSTPEGIAMLVIGTLTGGVIAAAIFATTAFSIPMLMDRETDFATAIASSVGAVLSRPKQMFLWAWIIVLSVAVGAATFMVGFVFLFPLLGFATWRGYRSVFPPAS